MEDDQSAHKLDTSHIAGGMGSFLERSVVVANMYKLRKGYREKEENNL